MRGGRRFTATERVVGVVIDLLASMLHLLLPIFYWLRVRHGREAGSSKAQRFAKSPCQRPDGQLVWVHAVSIGEFNAALPLLMKLKAEGFNLLVTTTTESSAAIARTRLPKEIIHQYWPYDTPRIAARFLSTWRPDLAITVESEIWPVMARQLAIRNIPLIVINGAMSLRSFKRWRNSGVIGRYIMSLVERIYAKSEIDAQRFRQLGAANVSVVGNLKFDSPLSAISDNLVENTRSRMGARKFWLAVSTHPNEEEIVADIHAELAPHMPQLLTIIIPRHAVRGGDIYEKLSGKGFSISRRSCDDEITSSTEIYLADTMGETTLFYQLSDVVLMGGSLAGHGAHSPLEAAACDCAILCGSHLGALHDIYDPMLEADAIIQEASVKALSEQILTLLSDDNLRSALAGRACEYRRLRQGACDILAAEFTNHLISKAG